MVVESYYHYILSTLTNLVGTSIIKSDCSKLLFSRFYQNGYNFVASHHEIISIEHFGIQGGEHYALIWNSRNARTILVFIYSFITFFFYFLLWLVASVFFFSTVSLTVLIGKVTI